LKSKKQKLYDSKDTRYFDLNPEIYKGYS